MNKKHRLMNLIFKFVLFMMLWATFPVVAVEPGESYSIARGARLYDKWYKENSYHSPKKAHPAYPDTGKYKGKKGADWRCKECHGWDYKGKDGQYSSGKHYSGISGIMAAKSKSRQELTDILGNSTHQYSPDMLSESDKRDLVSFIKYGMIDMSQYINVKTKMAKGNAEKGKDYFETLCATCHGLDAKQEDMPELAKLARKNPWEVMHKTLYGQPLEEMPALIVFGASVASDIISYLQHLKSN